jgi:MATE family multidrug resistance protein
MALLQQTVAYLTTFVAQYYGAREPESIGPATWQALYLSVVGGLLFLAFIPFSDFLFDIIGHPPAIRGYEMQYFDALCYSALPTAIVAGVSSFFSGIGQTKKILWINFAGMVANLLFDYLMIFGKAGLPAMGIAGAGYATAISAYISALLGLALLLQGQHERAFRVMSGWRPNVALIRRFLRFGVPSGLQWALEGLAFSVFLMIVGRMANGSSALASSSIVVTVMMLAVLPPLGLAQAVSIRVGQLLGDKKGDEASGICWSGLQLALAYIVLVASSFLLFPSFYLGWFENKQDPLIWGQVSQIVPILLMYVAFFTCFDCVNFVCSFTLKGAGDTRFVSLVALSLPWPLMVLPTWLVRHEDGAIYWAWGFASIFSVTQAIIFFRRFWVGKWQTMSVIH